MLKIYSPHSCSRWEELTDTIHWHATLAARLRAPTTFVLLNPPGNGEPQSCRVGYERDKRWLHRGHDSIYCDPADGSITHTVDEDSAEFEVERLKNMLASGPGGKTPLCAAVTSVCGVLARRAPELRSRGRKACVVIASDGAATDGDVHAALAPLRDLPVWVIVRLCTDEEKVVNYWGRVDEDLELDMDVLDDLVGEANEVCELNPWLSYPMVLHRLREFGSSDKIFDLLDERPLSLAEARAGKESEIPNFKGSSLGRCPVVSADFWTSDHLSGRPRSVDAFFGTRARGTLTLKRR